MTTIEKPVRPTIIPRLAGWSIVHHGCVSSTQALARDLPAWSAVWADAQSGGRGQEDRVFVSDHGGVYLTAVLPYDGDALAAKGFALAVGWAICTAIRRIGVASLRLRWPNDLMAGDVKVGGILVEQGGRRTLLVGVGLNVTNSPWKTDPSLQDNAGRLADSFGRHPVPPRDEWLAKLLRAIRLAHREFARLGLAGFASRLEQCWDGTREVVLEPVRGITLAATHGTFLGIDGHGALRLRTAPGVEARVPAHHINRLREVRRQAAARHDNALCI